MIAIESFRRYRVIDLAAIAIIAIVFLAADFLLSLIGPLYYPLVILLLVALMSLVAYLVRKAGAATLFYITAAVLTFSIDDIGVLGIQKVIVFLLAGVIFELLFLLLRFEIRSVPVDIIFSASLSAALIPIATSLIMSAGLVLTFPLVLINLTLLSFTAGFVGSLIAFFVWSYLRTSRAILRFEYEQ